MNFTVITSTHRRHISFLEMLKKNLEINSVFLIDKPSNLEFAQSEASFFKNSDTWNNNIFPIYCDKNQINSSRVAEIIQGFEPDICFVFGAPLLKEKIFSIPRRGCINIHTGMVQHHRGVGSPYWAIHENRPETIGVTIHLIDKNIDTGNIIAQKQTTGLAKTDSCHDIFMKTCITGIKLLEEKLPDIISGTTKARKLENKGKLYQSKDMTWELMQEIKFKTPHVLKDFLDGNNSRSL